MSEENAVAVQEQAPVQESYAARQEKLWAAKEHLESALTHLVYSEDYAYLGRVLQGMNIKFNNHIPTAGIGFNKKLKQFEMLINTDFLLKQNRQQASALLLHEILHILFSHLTYNFESYNKVRLNVAQDLTINQYIKNLPDGCMLIANFNTKDGKPFPAEKHTEFYYELLSQEGTEMTGPDGKKQPYSDFEKRVSGGDGRVFDIHGTGDEASAEAKEQLEAMKDLVGRAEKCQDFSQKPEFIKRLLEEMDSRIQKLDYKGLLLKAIRRSMPSADRTGTWKRENKKWGQYARGTTVGKLPTVTVLIDTSGSIDDALANEFLGITNNFLLAGAENVEIGFFHTSLYHKQKVKKNFKVQKENLESGGTDVTSAMEYAIKRRSDLIIMLTDGYFSMPAINEKSIPKNCVFVISNGGTVSHPLAKFGTSIQYA